MPTEAEAKEAAQDKYKAEADKQRRIRKVLQMEEKLKVLRHSQKIAKVVESDPTLVGNPRRRDSMIQQELATFKQQQRAARQKRHEEQAAAKTARAEQ